MRVNGWDQLSRVTTNPFGGHDIPGAYSPDGSRLAFAREDPGRKKLAIFVTRRGGGKARRVSPWLPDISSPDWSPNGRWLIYDNAKGSLMLVRPNGTHRHRLRLALDGHSGRQAGSAGRDDHEALLQQPGLGPLTGAKVFPTVIC